MTDYIDYLKSNDNEKVNESIIKFQENKITIKELELVAIENKLFTRNVYEKCFKLGSLLRD